MVPLSHEIYLHLKCSQVWKALLWLRGEHPRTHITILTWHSSPPLTVRLISREAGPALNRSHLDFYHRKGRQCLRWTHRGKAWFSLITERKLLSAAVSVGLEIKQCCIYFYPALLLQTLSHLWFTGVKNLSEPWNLNNFPASQGFSCNTLTSHKGQRKACREPRQWTCPLQLQG